MIGFGLFSLTVSCELINPIEEVPAYLEVEKFSFSTSVEQGANSEKISDAWVFIDEVSLGIYELPATIPNLNLGNRKVTIFPVVRENALPQTPIIYPFYERYELLTDLVSGQVYPIKPVTGYLSSNTVFELVEDFEGSNHRLNGGDPNAVRLINDPDKVRTGNGSGQVLLESMEQVTFTSSASFLDLPTEGGLPVFLELDYKTNISFEIGLVGIDVNPALPVNATNFKIILCPVDFWNKVYINFQEDLTISQLPAYKLAFRVSKDNQGCSISENIVPEVLIDNVKFIRFQN